MNDEFDQLAKGTAPLIPSRCLTLAILCLVAPGSAFADTYTVTDLGTLGGDNSRAFALNNKGAVVGSAANHQTGRSFVWKPVNPNGVVGTISEIGGSFFGNRTPTAAFAINDRLQEIADETDYQVISPDYLWQDGAGPSWIVPPPDGAAGWAINSSGQIAGEGLYYPPGANFSVRRSMLWKPATPNGTNGTMVFLPQVYNYNVDTYAYGINDYGQVVGDDGEGAAFLFTPFTPNGTNGSVIALPNFVPGSVALAINNGGQVVGVGTFYDEPSNSYNDRAWLWTPFSVHGSSGSLLNLGVLSASPNVFNSSEAYAINSAGQVVGTTTVDTGDVHAFLWDRSHGMRDLNALIPTNSGWEVFEAYGINDAGQIAASGFFTNRGNVYNHALLLTPVLPARLSSPTALANGQFRFTLLGQPGRSYSIYASSDLLSWSALTNFVSLTGTNEITDTSSPALSRRFYRALTQ